MNKGIFPSSEKEHREMMEKVADRAIKRQEETLRKAAEQSLWIREQVIDVVVRLTRRNTKLEMHSAMKQVYEIAKDVYRGKDT